MWKPSILYCWWKPCDIWQNDSKIEMVCPGTHILSWHKNSSSEALWPDYWCRLVGTSHLNMHSLEKETYEISPSWEKNSTLGNQRCGPALYTCPCSQTKRVAQEKGSGAVFTSSSYSPFLGTSQYLFLVRSFNWSAWNASTDKRTVQKFQHLFQKPYEFPPSREFDHHIPLVPGAHPVNVRPYRYSPQ